MKRIPWISIASLTAVMLLGASIATLSPSPARADALTCVDDPPPRLGYTCDCSHPGYTASIDGRSCVDKNDCTTDHCAEGGDSRGSCACARTDNKNATAAPIKNR